MIKIKICGITNSQDALWAANLGADYVGLNFYSQSPRKISAKHAKEIAAQLPPFVVPVGIFVDEDPAVVAKLIKSVPLKVVQLHGSESPEYCRSVRDLGIKVIKAFRLQKALDPSDVAAYTDASDYYLFDNFRDDVPGGTGETFAWEWLQVASTLSKPWFLSGGLNPDNVLKAIKQVQPAMVDVCSGIERLPTRKDYEAMKKFIQSVKAVR